MKHLRAIGLAILLVSLMAVAASAAAKKRPKMAKIPRGKPEIFELQPRGIERGTTNLPRPMKHGWRLLPPPSCRAALTSSR